MSKKKINALFYLTLCYGSIGGARKFRYSAASGALGIISATGMIPLLKNVIPLGITEKNFFTETRVFLKADAVSKKITASEGARGCGAYTEQYRRRRNIKAQKGDIFPINENISLCFLFVI